MQNLRCTGCATTTRMVFLAHYGLSAMLWALASLVAHAPAMAAESLPNVVLIISDDQAWSDYSFMQHPHIQTPNLDRLASQSMLWTRGYVPNSLCRPSLASIITGRYAHQHGIVGNDPPLPAAVQALPGGKRIASPDYAAAREEYLQHIDRAATLPKLLSQKGYLSFQSGKWWEGHYSRGGFTHGMTHGDVSRGGRHGDVGLDIGRKGLEPIAEFLTTAQQAEKPFFIWYAPMLPHMPHNPPQRLLDKYLKQAESPSIAKYWAMCEWFDETCGQLLTLLDERSLSDDTIVIYVTDNGWITDPQASRYAPKSKRSPYDGGLRTPLMIRWPNKVEPQREQQQLVTSLDIVPTVLAACGIDAPPDLPGVNLLDPNALHSRRQVFGEIFEHDVQHMTDPLPSLMYRWTIEGHWKLIVSHEPRVTGQGPELYDLQHDPWEKANLAQEHPEVVQRLRTSLDQWWP